MVQIKQLLNDILISEQATNTLLPSLLLQLAPRLKSFSAAKDPIFKQVRDVIIKHTQYVNSTHMECKLWHLINHVTTIPSCKQCKNLVNWDHGTHRYRTFCSAKCKGSDLELLQSIQDTNMKKYGTISPTQNQDIKHKISNTWNQKTKNEIALIVKSRTNTLLTNHGVTTTMDVPGARAKQQQTCISKWGVPFISQRPGYQQYMTQVWLDKTPEQLQTRNNKSQHTVQEKFGVNNPSQSEEVKEKKKQTNLRNNNVTNPNYIGKDMTLFDNLKDPAWLQDQHYTQRKSLTEISNELHVENSTVSRYMNHHNIPVKFFQQSIGEKQLSQFLTDNNLVHETNNRTVIHPQELDIYLPNYKLAIEYCGLYWHSEQKGKTRHYHEAKYKKCKEQGIQLLTIFEDEWTERQEQVKKKILHTVGQNNDKIFARNTTIVTLNTKQKDLFFNENHIQGTGPGSITYGLIYNDSIVAAITFINQKSGNFVLNRYATNTTVPGGFGKLLNHFQQNNKWNTIVSFADLRWSTGNLYNTTGWTVDKIIPPDYSYSFNGLTRSHKFNYRRKNLPKLLKLFDPLLSETQNCDTNGILRIWDCGKIRYILRNPNHKYFL